MIAHSDILRGIHNMIDLLQDVGDQGDYYKLNHLAHEDFERLARIIAVWLALQKIEVRYPTAL